MKLGKLTLSLFTAALIATISFAETKIIKDESIGLRKDNLYTEDKVVSDETKYKTDPAGASTKIERAFENAPPMIPHDVEGMFIITSDNNQCTACHDPAIAASMGATPIPKSHYTSFREAVELSKDGNLQREGKAVANSSDLKSVVKPLETLSNARFNCSACHAPQSDSTNVPKNNFTPEFRSTELNGKSNLIDVIGEGVK
ncbi:periplasmic nitrate reductase NapAB, small subunit, periplasmic diheme cytochrome c550 protein [Aliarcobacter cibarius]|uniref:nitrate reductase cytochrome c-type subunit n=1 Tax=Aliarcobacter cibarius TaxID=255507 RepID=UPI0012481DF4|nr:nitrate reductase cytochrome c-type subunit [Aliarcobacter cibarius]QEZ89759.1 periplasmic nitrate reductase NapAB, small subunit, periplasmic diheme cytochrome c550 protein [Aliarcobacter cibarius]